jgi:hypothetical protein
VLVGIIQFPKIKHGRNEDFLRWFDWSNSEFMRFDGFVSRKLLKSKLDDSYLAIMELKDGQTYMDIHKSEIHKMAFAQLVEILEGIPKKSFYSLQTQ